MTAGTTIPGVKNLIVVASGKGGVGKTTVAVNLAIALQVMGAAVGLLDADVYGPNVPTMLGATEPPRAESERVSSGRILPAEDDSMGLVNSADKPVIWRGRMLHSVIQQFLRSVKWGELDYLIVDLPPGTGDVQLTLIQSVVVSGAVIVTTPSMVALADVRKAIEMFRQLKVEILGVVENMSYFNCRHCNARIDILATAKASGWPKRSKCHSSARSKSIRRPRRRRHRQPGRRARRRRSWCEKPVCDGSPGSRHSLSTVNLSATDSLVQIL